MPVHFVPPRRPSAARRLFMAAVALFAPQPKPKPAKKPPEPGTPRVPAPIYVELPPHVWRIREQGREAKWLLSRYCRNVPTSRRKCMEVGFSDGSWRRARRILIRAGVISAYDGRLLYSARDAQLRLDVYLDEVERKARESDRFVAP